eukprot:gene8226-biopygen9334
MRRDRTPQTDPAKMYQKIKEISGRRSSAPSGCIQSNDDETITEKEKALERLTEYLEELFKDDRGNKPTIKKNFDGSKILKSETESALKKMKKNKAAGPDEITAEMLTFLDDLGMDKLTEVVNKVYDSGEIPDDLSKSIFIALPKKLGATIC